jgi:hypothetical protein
MQPGQSNPEPLISLWGEPLVKASALPASEQDSQTHAEDSCLPILKSLGVFGLDGLSGRTSPVSCHQGEDGILVPSSGRWGNWGMGGPTVFSTLNGAEHTGIHAPCRSAGDVCSLSGVLETQPVPPRFSLSAKACSGILRRAERRGKALPPMLKAALAAVAGCQTTPEL